MNKKSPLLIMLIVILYLDRLNAPYLVWGAFAMFFIFAWIGYFQNKNDK